MSTRLFLLPLAALFTTGCLLGGGDLSGEWEGELDCDGTVIDLAMDLDDDGGGEFGGDFFFISEQTGTGEDGVFYELFLDIEYDVVFEVFGGGEQEITGDAEYDGADCLLIGDGEVMSDDCEEMGFDEGNLDDANSIGDGFTWDGDDTIEIDDDDCEGELER